MQQFDFINRQIWLPRGDNYKTNVLVQSDTAGHYQAIGDQVNMAHKKRKDMFLRKCRDL